MSKKFRVNIFVIIVLAVSVSAIITSALLLHYLPKISATTNQGDVLKEQGADSALSKPEQQLIASLPMMTKDFYMEYNGDTKRYLVTLYVNPNDKTLGSTDIQLDNAREAARIWVATFNIDIDNLAVNFTDAY